ncbi:MAG: diguanylate cyclase [Desulfobacterales bacterium]
MTEKKLKILVVDDEIFVRDMLEAILRSEEMSVEVETADNGGEALERYRQHPDTDLIISDMNMPVMDGLELIRNLRNISRDVPIIILTGNSEIKTAIKALNSGASDYLLKDENIEDTIPVSVKRVMEKYHLERQNRELLKELARKNRELERLSLLDPLTDIPNRRWFDKVMEQEWSRAIREKHPLSLIMADIDWFKSYNDTYGHQEGDNCLREVARVLNRSLQRPGDFAARYGGEEFAVILPDTDEKGARKVAETMLKRIAEHSIPHAASEIAGHVTLSMGFSTARPERKSALSQLIENADQALYRAKTEGRNRAEQFLQPDRGE